MLNGTCANRYHEVFVQKGLQGIDIMSGDGVVPPSANTNTASNGAMLWLARLLKTGLSACIARLLKYLRRYDALMPEL